MLKKFKNWIRKKKRENLFGEVLRKSIPTMRAYYLFLNDMSQEYTGQSGFFERRKKIHLDEVKFKNFLIRFEKENQEKGLYEGLEVWVDQLLNKLLEEEGERFKGSFLYDRECSVRKNAENLLQFFIKKSFIAQNMYFLNVVKNNQSAMNPFQHVFLSISLLEEDIQRKYVSTKGKSADSLFPSKQMLLTYGFNGYSLNTLGKKLALFRQTVVFLSVCLKKVEDNQDILKIVSEDLKHSVFFKEFEIKEILAEFEKQVLSSVVETTKRKIKVL